MSDVFKELKKYAAQIARQITRDAKQNLGNKAKYVSVTTTTEKADDTGISHNVTASNTTVREPWGVVNVARAFEYGSGIHGRRKSKYVIKPRFKKVLAFFWDKVDENTPSGKKFIGISESGKAMFRLVEPPGISAVKNGRGYINPAIDKARRQMKREIPKIAGEDIRISLRRSFMKGTK
jgi:hypothetical protein